MLQLRGFSIVCTYAETSIASHKRVNLGAVDRRIGSMAAFCKAQGSLHNSKDRTTWRALISKLASYNLVITHGEMIKKRARSRQRKGSKNPLLLCLRGPSGPGLYLYLMNDKLVTKLKLSQSVYFCCHYGENRNN